MASDGSITFSTELDNSALEKGLKEAEAEIEALKRKVAEAKAAGAPGTEIADYYKQLEDAYNRYRNLLASKPQASVDTTEATSKLESIAQGIHDKLAGLMSNIGNSGQNMLMAFGNAVESVIGRISLLGSLGLVTLAGAFFGGVVSRLREIMAESQMLQNAITTLKGVFAGFVNYVAAGIANIAIPAIVGFIRVVISMLMTLARLIDSIFKTNFLGSITSSLQSIAAGSGAATDAAGKQAKATNKLAKATKEAVRQLMAFDELNVLNADKSNDNADNLDDLGDGVGAGGGGGGFDPSELISGIDDALAQIMIIAGAMIMAVGLILALSGTNVPLGLALIAIGALMIYTAATEQWDKLPQEVQERLLTILMAIGGILIVIGVILVCTGHIPLGIAFIIAGAAMFVTAATIDPELMSNMVEGAKEHILGIIAGALIVVGFILCLTGVGMPVGVALIAAGALLFVGEATLNWDSMSEEMRGFVSTAMRIIGGALIVVGIMLCITMPGIGMALGIAAIIAGITVFVSQAALNEKDLPGKIESFFAKAVPILAGALVVIGIILCIFLPGIGIALGIACIVAGIGLLSVAEERLDEDYLPAEVDGFMNGLLGFIKSNAEFLLVLGIILLFSPVTIGLGIACIIAGIAGMVMPEDYDFNALKDKISEVWDGVVDWWHTNVEHIFTLEFWQGVFGSIVDGLWGALGEAGNAINGFFSDIGNGIAQIAGDIGIGFQMGIPQIDLPFLASGAVIPPNKSFLAVLGDQTAGRNLEAPESLIRQIVREESGSGGEMIDVLNQMLDAIREGSTLYVDGQVLGRTAYRELNTMVRMSGV